MLFLAVFIVLCGLHLGGVHHDGDGDGLVVASDVLLAGFLVSLLFGLTSVRAPWAIAEFGRAKLRAGNRPQLLRSLPFTREVVPLRR